MKAREMILWVLVALMAAAIGGLVYNSRLGKLRDILLQEGQRTMYSQMKEIHPEFFNEGNPILGE